jgi:ArsR family transcriptional regulator
MTAAVCEAESDVATATARFFKVLSDPTRLEILELLTSGPQSVSDLVLAVGVSQARISNHLACLRWCKFVEFDKVGRQVIYRVGDERIAELIALGKVVSAEHCDHLASCTRIGPQWV